MVRGLVIRQGFFVADIVLAAIVALTVYMLVSRIFSGPNVSATAQPEPFDLAGVEAEFHQVKPRAEYENIITSGIFGPAARLNRDTVPVEPVVETPVEQETALPLRLTGTVISGENQIIATALIEMTQGGRAGTTFYVGEEVLEGVVLYEVRPDEVVLDNKNTNAREVLKRELDPTRFAAASAAAAAPEAAAPERTSSSNVMSLDRAELSTELIENYEEIATTLDIREYVDEEGNVAGITASNVSDVAISEKLGLQNDDVLTSINNEPIESVDKVYEVLNKYRNASTFRLGILRGGKPQFITYRLR